MCSLIKNSAYIQLLSVRFEERSKMLKMSHR